MSKKYRLKNVIGKLEAIHCDPLYYAVAGPSVVRDFVAENFSSQKPRTREGILYIVSSVKNLR